MLTSDLGEGVYWARGMSIPIRRVHEMIKQSPAPSELSNPQIYLLPCGLDHIVKGWGQDPLGQTSIWVRATGSTKPADDSRIPMDDW